MYRQKRRFKIDSTRHGSSRFKVVGTMAYLIEKQSLFLVQDRKEFIKAYVSQNNDLEMIKSSNCLLVGNSDIGYDRINQDKSIIYEDKLKGFKLPFDSQSDKVYFFTRDVKVQDFRSGVYDMNTHSILFIKDTILNVVLIDENFYLTADNSRVDRQGNILWQIRLQQFGNIEVKKIFGVYRNQLLVACSDHLLISVDVNTGVVVRRWRELPGFDAGQPYKNVLPEPTNFVLDKSIGKLIGAFDTYYFEIDIESGECLYTPLKDELTKFGISDFRSFNNNPFTESHLFLTAHTYLSEFPNVDLSSVLALNRRTKKVDWIHVFKGSGLGTNVPQITSTYLYQLDTENNLHIFERVS